MARTIWDWLEIEATKDKRLIKKAYAEQSKKYHPEDAPEEARQLRNAYKLALAYAENDIKTQTLPQSVQVGFAEDVRKASSENADEVYQDTFHEQYEQVETDTSYSYNFHQFEADRAERLQRFSERIFSVCENPDYRESASFWSYTIKDKLIKEDLKDIYVIAEIISILEQIPIANSWVPFGLRRILFRYSLKDAEWRRLEMKFAALYPVNRLWGVLKDKNDESAGGLLIIFIFFVAIVIIAPILRFVINT